MAEEVDTDNVSRVCKLIDSLCHFSLVLVVEQLMDSVSECILEAVTVIRHGFRY